MVNARSNREDVESVAAEVREMGRQALPILADVGNREELEKLLDQTLSEFGHLDIVINNASVRPHKPFTEMSYDDWRGVSGNRPWTRRSSPHGPRCQGCWSGAGAGLSTWAGCRLIRAVTAVPTSLPPRLDWWVSPGPCPPS